MLVYALREYQNLQLQSMKFDTCNYLRSHVKCICYDCQIVLSQSFVYSKYLQF